MGLLPVIHINVREKYLPKVITDFTLVSPEPFFYWAGKVAISSSCSWTFIFMFPKLMVIEDYVYNLPKVVLYSGAILKGRKPAEVH